MYKVAMWTVEYKVQLIRVHLLLIKPNLDMWISFFLSLFKFELKTERNLLTEGYYNGHSDPWEAPLRKRLFFSAVNPCS